MAESGPIHMPADEYGIEIRGSEKPPIRRVMGGYYEARCTCGWRDCRRYRAVVERKFSEHCKGVAHG